MAEAFVCVWVMAALAGLAIPLARGRCDPARLAIFLRHYAACADALFFLGCMAAACLIFHSI